MRPGSNIMKLILGVIYGKISLKVHTSKFGVNYAKIYFIIDPDPVLKTYWGKIQ